MTTAILFLILSGTCCAVAQETPADYRPEDLWAAAREGDADLVRRILAAGIRADSPTTYGATALSFAAERGHLDVVKVLVEAGADVNHVDSFYNVTPRAWAQMSGHKEVAGFLEKHGGKTAVRSSSPATGGKEGEADSRRPEYTYPAITAEAIAQDDREASSGNWPQFRGTGARGIADGQQPPVQWDVPTREQLAWKTPIPGLGHSCPVIWEQLLFVTSAVSAAGDENIRIGYYGDVDSVEDNSPHKFVLYCLDKETGRIRWERVAHEGSPQVKRHLKSTHANPTVATDGQHVVAFFGSAGLYCYTMQGDLVWRRDLGQLDSGWFYDPAYQWGFGSSPVVFGEFVIVQCDVQQNSFLAAFRLANGEEVWRVDRDEIASWSTPTVQPTPAGPMVITNGTRAIRGYDARTGELWWWLKGNSEIVVPTPFVAYETIILAAGYRPIQPIYAVRLAARGDISLEKSQDRNRFVRWSYRQGGPYLPTPLAYRGQLYTCGNAGVVTSYDVATGEMLYRERLKTSGERSFVASPIAADEHLYFTAEDGHVLVVKAGPEFELVRENLIGENVLATPAISERTIFFRGQHHLFAIRH
jgi:outer membrane protein assembly factor BamB